MSIEVGRVGMVPIEYIQVEDRSRKDLGDLTGLEDSMKESGLIQPLAVMILPDGWYKLLAGERRFTVLKNNNVVEIPVRIFDRELTQLEMKIIEKSENFHRKDMEYWEYDQLVQEIHSLQQGLHGPKLSGPGDSGWSITNTGELLGNVNKSAVSTAIKRADLRTTLPEAFTKCKTASDANKVIKKLDEALIKQAIAIQLKSEGGDKLVTELDKYYIIKSVFEGVKDMPSNMMHLVEIDPPYGIDLMNVKRGANGSNETHYIAEEYTEISKDIYIEGHPDPTNSWRGIRQLFVDCYRVMAEHSWLICWFAPEPWFEVMYQELCAAGFTTSRMCGIWRKPNGQTMQPEDHLANSYEMFFYAKKGKPALNKMGRLNVFDYPPIPAQNKVHPTERPIELTTEIYDTFAFPGSRVFIPFLGSGNGIISAHQLGLSPIGYGLSEGDKDQFLVKIHTMKK